MQVEFVEEGERLIARPEGRMEAADATDFASAVDQRLNARTKSVTINLEALEFVNLGGIRAILRLARSLKSRETSLDFTLGGHSVREALDHAGLSHLFPFTPPYPAHRSHHHGTQ